MKINDNYQDIAPYYDNDLKPVLKKMIKEPGFLKLAQSINPAITSDILTAQILHINTIHDFQKKFISPIIESILHKSVKNLTFSGLENINTKKSYLFISNHRDILLDSTLLNYILLHHDFDSTQMAIGDNLLLQPWITDFFKLNKGFIIQRSLPGREMFHFSKRLSNYIAHTLHNNNQSIWIAQREGRTKNGCDKTQSGLLKMLTMAESKNFQEYIISLNIIPIAISYQYEPCDKMKARETLKKQNENFQKSPKADLYSMISGIRNQKGNIHISIGKSLNEDFENFDVDLRKNYFLKATAELLDKKIYKLYKLWNTNYIAYDILNHSDKYCNKYSKNEKQKFENYLSKLCSMNEKIRPFLLDIYAGPVKNSLI